MFSERRNGAEPGKRALSLRGNPSRSSHSVVARLDGYTPDWSQTTDSGAETHSLRGVFTESRSTRKSTCSGDITRAAVLIPTSARIEQWVDTGICKQNAPACEQHENGGRKLMTPSRYVGGRTPCRSPDTRIRVPSSV